MEQFALFLEEKQILRCRGRINNSIVPPTSKNPILLPSRHPFVDLLIRHTHEHVKHSAVTTTLTTLRERFWILKGRQAVKRVLKRCVTCRRLEGLPYSSYNSPDLPSFRVSDDPPFTHTGVDFAGPLYIEQSANSEREGSKCYICLFTCASTRAVNLELTRIVTVESFLFLGSLRSRVFETGTATGSQLFLLLTCHHTTTFKLLGIFSPLETSSIQIWGTILS